MAKKEVKCIFCNGKIELCYEDLFLLDDKVALKKEPYYKCSNCKREYVSSTQMKETEKKLQPYYATRPVIATGRSLAITLPTDIAKFCSIKKGTQVQIIPESKTILKIKLA
jgi:hypothetical protein